MNTYKVVIFFLASLVLSSCAFAPGMNIEKEAFATQEVDRTDFREGVTIQPINGKLVTDQLRALSDQRPVVVPEELQEDVSTYQYLIAPQDVLKITVWDHPELTAPEGNIQTLSGNLVYDDGTIFYPYVGSTHVAGKTMEEVRLLLTRGLKNYIEKPQVGVQVTSFRGRLAYVTGQVNKPGALSLNDQPLTVMNAISQVGGVLAGADLQHAILTRDGKTYPLDLFSLYERGKSSLNILLHDGDVLNIPDNELNKVFVLGELSKPATLFVKNGKLTLAEAISDTQGFGAAANTGQVYVIRGKRAELENDPVPMDRLDELAQLEIYHLDASSPEALMLADQFRLHARDVVYVSPTELKRFSRVFTDLGKIINTTAQTFILQRTLFP